VNPAGKARRERLAPARFARPEVLNQIASSVQINAQNVQVNFESYERMRARMLDILHERAPLLEEDLPSKSGE
jgi:hypothetical protein